MSFLVKFKNICLFVILSFVMLFAFQNFTPVNNIVENTIKPGSDITNSFESDLDLSGWNFFNNCSPGSFVGKAFTAPEQRIDGTYTLRLQTKNFQSPCDWPGVYAQSPIFEVHDGRTIRVSAHIRNATFKGRTMIMFFDQNGRQLSATNSDWNFSQVWDWPNWHRQNVLTSTAPLGAVTYKIRFDLISPNAIVDIDALQITGDKLKGFFFNPKAEYAPGKYIEIAWENNLLLDAYVKASVTKELDLLVNKAHVNFLYIMVNTATANPTELNKVTANLAEFVNIAWQRKIQVGIFLAHHCIVDDTYPESFSGTHNFKIESLGSASADWKNGFDSCGKANKNIEIAKAWYSSMIKGVEANVKDARGIAFWEMGGHPESGAAEMPIWNNSNWEQDIKDTKTGLIHLGSLSFIKKVWPYFTSLTKRPKAFTVFPIIANGSSMLDSLLNFKLAIRGYVEPDYYLLTSTVMTPLASDSFNRITQGSILDYIPSNKTILGDFQWQQNDWSKNKFRASYNPNRWDASTIAKTNFAAVKNHKLAGWWIWAYRDQAKDLSEGILDENNQWKEPQTSTVVNELRWPNE